MKKLFALCLALALLCGCAGQGAASETAPEATPTPSPTPTPAAEPSPEVSRELTPGLTIVATPEVTPSTTPEPTPQPTPQVRRLSFIAVGDNLLHNTVLDAGKQSDGSYDYTSFYESIAPVIGEADLAAVNQETPLVYDPALYGSYPEFGSPTAIGDALAEAGFNIVTMATNHICDRGDRGITDSLRFWREEQPQVALLGIHESEDEPVTVVEKNGIKVALLNYTYGYNGYGPSQGWMADSLGDEEKLLADMARAEQAGDCTIVFLHAGTEYSSIPDESQRRWFRFFAQAGAEAIIGAHPHVVQPMEYLQTDDGRQVPVWWSLGNFLSHQLEAERWVGAMASFDIVMEDDVVRIEKAEIIPTFTYIWYEGTRLCFQSLLLSQMTEELAAKSYYRSYYGTVDALWEIFRRGTGEEG